MLFDLLGAMFTGDADALKWRLASVLLALPVILLALCLHETAHGFVAKKLGDPTASSLGRLTLNPLKHLDPIGFICMLCFGFGWAKPVPINTRYFKKPRRDMVLCALAGPVSNIILAFVFALLLKISTAAVPLGSQLTENMFMFTCLFLWLGIRLNITLAVFNLLPIPPLDGSKILFIFLPKKWIAKIIEHERIIYFVMLALLFLGVLDYPINFLSDLLLSFISIIFAL